MDQTNILDRSIFYQYLERSAQFICIAQTVMILDGEQVGEGGKG